MTRAAEQLHVTQPTLSKALKSLEDELDKKLFTRHSFSIRLTDEGVLLRDRAEDLENLAFYDAIMNDTEVKTKPEQAMVVTQILEGIYKSAESGKPYYFNEGE